MLQCNCQGNPLSASWRREFLTVGASGRWATSSATCSMGEARPAGTLAAERRAKRPAHFPAGRHGPPGIVRPQAVCPAGIPGLVRHREDEGPARSSARCRQTAAVADKISVIRSMTHGEAAHERGTHNMFTGYRPSPAIAFPSLGSVVSHELGSRNNLPPYVCIPNDAQSVRGHGLPELVVRAVQPGRRSGRGRVQGPRSEPCRAAIDDARFARRRTCWTR